MKTHRWFLALIILIGLLGAVWYAISPTSPLTHGQADYAGTSQPAGPQLPTLSSSDWPLLIADNEPIPAAPAQPAAPPAENIVAILENADFTDPESRARAVAAIEKIEFARKRAGILRAEELGLPLRVERPDGTVMEIAGVDERGKPVYFTTHNATAAISTGANLMRTTTPGLTGTGLTVGVWDGGSGLATHQEFASRLTVMDSSAPIDHATHVSGTIAASGVTSSARGMATAASIHSYDWTLDNSEMTNRAAAAPNQSGKIYLSNHSYGYISGWYKTGGSNPAYIWYGSGTTSTSQDPNFGQYNSYSAESDALAFNAPYYLMFRSAGNDRGENPSNGQTVRLSSTDTATTSYDSAIHPGGDGTYRGGYDNISFNAIGKNVITVGSIADAVSGGLRSFTISPEMMSSFSSWGPTNDGRIKPDVVANGESVYSSVAGTTSAYSSYNGTSMSTPNATGTATLLIEEFARHFPSSAMRSSTLKGLLIHTADDMGNPGPDYKYGWGLLDGMAALNLIRDHAANPLKTRMVEGLISSTNKTINHDFIWDGLSPIRVTLCWTDPAGSTVADDPTKTPTIRLRNNLDLKVVAPNASTSQPFVMPFVGTWTQASMSANATTGVNNTDNVEQVFIATPSPSATSATYRVTITFQGTLVNNQQHYSLLIDGSANVFVPPPPITLESVSPNSAAAGGTATLDLTGLSLATATNVKLTRSGAADILATNLEMIGSILRCRVDLTAAAAGPWTLVVSNPNDPASSLVDGFTVTTSLFNQNFDGTVSGWTLAKSGASLGWSIVTTQAHSPTKSYFTAAPDRKGTAILTTPAIIIPPIPDGMQLSFWHSYNTQASQDGGRIEFSIDNGTTWFGIEDANSGASFGSNGYNSTIATPNGNNPNGSDFAGKAAWSGNSNGFIRSLVNLTSAKFANKTIRLRWAFATNNSTASHGWYVDSISLIAGGNTNTAPTITTPANIPGATSTTEIIDEVTYTRFLVPGTSANATVAASDNGGAANLTYTWAANGPAIVSFSPNGTNGAASTQANFEALGDYSLTVTVTDSGGLSTSSTALVRVTQVATSLVVTPSSVSLPVNATQQFQGSVRDQFNAPMASQPASFSWTTTGGGSVSSSGLFTATAKGSNFTVSASASVSGTSFSGLSLVNVTPLTATITIGSLSHTYSGSSKSATATTAPGTYPVSFSYNGMPAPPSSAGSYAVIATVDTSTHEGSATATMTIAKAAASVTLSGLSQAYDGSSKVVGVTVVPSKPYLLTYGDSATAPSAVGTYAVLATVTDANYQGSASGQLTITSNFLAWEQGVFSPAQISAGDGAPGADADKDGLLNLAEYALGTNPNSFTAPPLVDFSPSALSLTFTRPKGLTDITYAAESSAVPGSWSPVSLELLSSTETTETLRAQVSRAQYPTVRFLRLRFVR